MNDFTERADDHSAASRKNLRVNANVSLPMDPEEFIRSTSEAAVAHALIALGAEVRNLAVAMGAMAERLGRDPKGGDTDGA